MWILYAEKLWEEILSHVQVLLKRVKFMFFTPCWSFFFTCENTELMLQRKSFAYYFYFLKNVHVSCKLNQKKVQVNFHIFSNFVFTTLFRLFFLLLDLFSWTLKENYFFGFPINHNDNCQGGSYFCVKRST